MVVLYDIPRDLVVLKELCEHEITLTQREVHELSKKLEASKKEFKQAEIRGWIANAEKNIEDWKAMLPENQ